MISWKWCLIAFDSYLGGSPHCMVGVHHITCTNYSIIQHLDYPSWWKQNENMYYWSIIYQFIYQGSILPLTLRFQILLGWLSSLLGRTPCHCFLRAGITDSWSHPPSFLAGCWPSEFQSSYFPEKCFVYWTIFPVQSNHSHLTPLGKSFLSPWVHFLLK